MSAEHSGENIQQELLVSLRHRLGEQVYPGYPALADRLHSGLGALALTVDDRPVLPDGPWTVQRKSDGPEHNEAPSPDDQVAFVQSGLRLDSRGRPLHPWFKAMFADPAIGVVTGRGFYRKWGPNRTADPIVISGDQVLLVERNDTGKLALPGGFIDGDETEEDAARRETLEETGVLLPDTTEGVRVYRGPVADLRVTAHAWPHTAAFLFRVNKDELPRPEGADDARSADWFSVHDVLERGLFGSHRFLLQRALEMI